MEANAIARQVGAAQRDLFHVHKRVVALEEAVARLEAKTTEHIVDGLMRLRKELEADGALYAEIPAILLLSDVCDALGLDTLEIRAILGQRATLWVESWNLQSVWPVPRQTAVALPLTEPATTAVAMSP